METFDLFFDALGFEAVREGGSLLTAQEHLFHTPPLPPITLPFQQLEPPATTTFQYNRTDSYHEWKNMVLLTHPSACLGQDILHGAVVLMTPKGIKDDEMYGLVVNKPWRKGQAASTNTTSACLLRDVIRPNELARFHEDEDPNVQAMLDIQLYQGGPVQTSLMVLHELEEGSEHFKDVDFGDAQGDDVEGAFDLFVDALGQEGDDEGEGAGQKENAEYELGKDNELLIGRTGRLRLRVVEKVMDLQKLIQQKVVHPKRCKIFVGLCVWKRDQLGCELERNVWIRTHCKDAKDLSAVGLLEMEDVVVEQKGEAGSKEQGVDVDAFAETFWRGSVSQLGAAYSDIAMTIETDHDTLLHALGEVVEDRAKRISERLDGIVEEEDQQLEDDDPTM